MNALISIANYGDAQLVYLQRQLAAFSMFSFDVDVVIDSTLPIPGVETVLHPLSIKAGLPYAHRRRFAARRNDYDLFIYLENDILLTEANVMAFLHLTDRLPADCITGFVRYEELGGEKYLTDLYPAWPVIALGLHRQNDTLVFCPANPHSACYDLTRSQLARAISSGGYATRPHRHPLGLLENGASDPYTQCGFRAKVLPLDFDELLVHHMPNRYVHIFERPSHTPESLKTTLLSHNFQLDLPMKRKIGLLQRVVRKLRRSIGNTIGR